MTKDLIINPTTWGVMRDQGTILVRSGFLPMSVKTPEQAIAIIMKGYELGMQPMQAFAHINVIQGKPTISSEGMLAQIWKSIPNAFIDFVRVEDEYCEIHAARPGRTPRKFVFQKSDADRAGLGNKDNWKKYPRAMYKARCISEMARTIFPDALMGCSHTAEELNPDVTINDEGEVIDIETNETSAEVMERAQDKRLEAFREHLKEMAVPEKHWLEMEKRQKGRPLKETPDILKELEQDLLAQEATSE